MNSLKLGRSLWIAAIIVAVVVADQVTKSWAQQALRSGPIHVAGPVYLRLFYNSGFAFSLGTGHPLAVAIIALVIAGGLTAYGLIAKSLLQGVASALVAGGAIGNLADRFFRDNHGAVIDFVSFPHWPVFNLADSAITVGVILLLAAGFRGARS